MKRRHDMPFGAALQDDGSVRFRLWAPSATRVVGSCPAIATHEANTTWLSCVATS